MKVLLLNPYSEGIGNIYPPLGLGYLATAVRRAGHVADIQDGAVNGWESAPPVADYIRQTHPDVVGVTFLSSSARWAKDVVTAVKSRFPGVVTVIGGAHVSGVPAQAMAQIPAHYGVQGEGEIPLANLLRKLEGHAVTVPGLLWRFNGAFRANPRVEPADLDALGFPAWDLLDMTHYHDLLQQDNAGWVLSGRGCPFACEFCVKLGRKLRFHSIPALYEQVELLNAKYGCDTFRVIDEGFAIHPTYAKDFCRYVVERGARFKYTVTAGFRASLVDDELCQLLRAARFWPAMAFGFESAVPRVRALMRKNLSQADMLNAIAVARRNHFRVIGQFILGYPGETMADLRTTLRFALENRLDGAHFNPLIPLPGSVLATKLLASGELSEDFDYSAIAMDCVLYAPDGMTKSQLRRFKKWAVLRFNFQLCILWRNLFPGKEWSIYINRKFVLMRFASIFLPAWLRPKFRGTAKVRQS